MTTRENDPRLSPYKRPVCRGAWALGTACGRCERCEETRPSTVAAKPPIRTAPPAPMPDHEGHFWGKWRIKDAGTADENETPGDEWEVMHVVSNSTAGDFVAMVPGVERSQSLENFVWGIEVKPPV